MKKTVLLLAAVTILSKILGFARDIVLSYFYGATNISDVYLISLTIPTVIFAIIGKGISVGYIPMYTRIEQNKGTRKADEYTNNIINLLIVISTVIFIIGMLFTESIVKLFANGFTGSTLALTIKFTRITLVGVYFTGLNYVHLAYLQLKGVFIVPALMGLPANIIAVVVIFISFHTNVYFLSIGSLLAIFSQFILIYIYSHKSNYRYKFMLDYRDENIRKMALLALPAIFGASIAQISLLIDRTLASKIAEGGITALNYANTLSGVIIGIFVLSISSVLYPNISRLTAENKIDEMKKVLTGAISTVNLVVFPAAIGCMIFSRPIVELMYGRGHFDSHAITMTSHALFYYSIGIIGLSHRETLSNTFYSLQDTKTPMLNSAMAMALNIVLNFILSKYLGIGGLALSTSIATLFCTFLLLVNLRRKLGSMGLKQLSTSFIKIFIASMIMGGISKIVYVLLINKAGLIVSFLSAVCLGVFVYFILIYLLKIKEVKSLVFEIKGKLRKVKSMEA